MDLIRNDIDDLKVHLNLIINSYEKETKYAGSKILFYIANDEKSIDDSDVARITDLFLNKWSNGYRLFFFLRSQGGSIEASYKMKTQIILRKLM